jgi:hypothetical protein
VSEGGIVSAKDRAGRFRQDLLRRFSLRWHMALILVGVATSAVLANSALRAYGLRSMPVRYAVAIALAYAVFFLLVWAWLAYVDRDRGEARDVADPSSSNSGSWSGGGSHRSRGSSTASSSRPVGGGGRSGGAGATASFGEERTDGPGLAGFFGSGKKSRDRDKSKSDSRGGGGPLGALGALLVFVLPLIVIGAVAYYLVSTAPDILGEIAFQAVLVRALLGRSLDPGSPTWLHAAFRRTRVAFAIVLGVVLIAGWYAQHRCPRAATAVEVLRLCGL